MRVRVSFFVLTRHNEKRAEVHSNSAAIQNFAACWGENRIVGGKSRFVGVISTLFGVKSTLVGIKSTLSELSRPLVGVEFCRVELRLRIFLQIYTGADGRRHPT